MAGDFNVEIKMMEIKVIDNNFRKIAESDNNEC